MGSPYRESADRDSVIQRHPSILRSGTYTKSVAPATVEVRWDAGSGYVEIGVHDGHGAPIQFARMPLTDARDLTYVLEIALRESNKDTQAWPQPGDGKEKKL